MSAIIMSSSDEKLQWKTFDSVHGTYGVHGAVKLFNRLKNRGFWSSVYFVTRYLYNLATDFDDYFTTIVYNLDNKNL